MNPTIAQKPNSNVGKSEMETLLHSIDWSKTPIGSIEKWSPSLQTALQLISKSPFPMFIWWGVSLSCFYNDACLALLGIRHSKTLGKPAAEVWQDNWSDLQALVETVIGQGEAVCREEVLCFVEKDNLKAETYLNFSYSPVFDGNNCAGGLCGLVKDVTPEVISRRRLETLHALSENSLAELKTVKEACQTTREILTKNLHDLPCAFIYLLDETGKTAHLCESDALTSTAKQIPQAIALDNKKADFWNFNKILATDQLPVIHDFAKTTDKIPALPWQEEWIRQAMVLPLIQAGLPAKPMGFLVTGISPLLDFNIDYQCFIKTIARHIAATLANVRALEEADHRNESADAVTPQAIAQKQIPESEQQLHSMIMQAPVGISILRGPDYIFEIINEDYEQLVGKSTDQLLGKPLLEVLPELQTQHIKELLDKVVTTGEPYHGSEFPVILNRFGQAETAYFNFVYQPLREPDGSISGVMAVANEVTELVRARKKVEESEERYRTLFESMDEGFCVVEIILDDQEQPVDYRFLEINPTFERQTGLAQALGKTAKTLVPNLESHWFEIYGKVALTGESVRFLNGSVAMNRWFDVYAYRVGGADSRKVGILFNDITQRKLAEEALHQSSEFNQNVLDSLAEHLAVVDKNGIITAVNRAWQRFAINNGADWTMRGVGVGANYLEVCHLPSDPEAMFIYEGIRDVLQGKREFFSVEYPCHAPNVKRWFLLNVAPLTYGEGGAVISHLNITTRRLAEEALRDSEERLRIATTSAELGTWDYDIILGELIWDKRTKELFGSSHISVVNYEIFLQRLHPEDRNYTDLAVQAALNGENNGIFDLEFRSIGLEDQRLRWIRAKGKAFFDEAGKPYRFIGTVLDITERKLVEEQKDAFMRIAGHELRTPLTSLVGYLSLMLKAPDNTEMVSSFLQKSYDSALKMRGLISDFLDFSKVQQGNLTFQVQAFDFDTLVADTVENMQISYPQHRIVLQGATNKIMEGDYGRIEQVLTNLLHNAIKYSPGKDRVEVELESKTDKIILRVKDYGVGIESKDLERIFNKFKRADNTGKIKGMGLGLYIVKEIVDFHQGSIKVTSTPGNGAVFTIEFPV